MDFDDPHTRAIFFELHSGLPREGPGSRAATARALALAGSLPREPRVLDIGCGPGQQTLDLAALLPDATVTAVDNHPPFVDEVRRRAAERGLCDRVRALVGDMGALAFPPASFDLIWCEGAAYFLGLPAALEAWRPLLAPGGCLALSEAVWLRPEPPAELRRVWDEEYPAMLDVAGCRRIVQAAGYDLLGDFVLPEAAWWDDYYTPMEQRVALLAERYAGDPVAEAVLQEARDEMALHRDYAAYYGYVFLVMGVGG